MTSGLYTRLQLHIDGSLFASFRGSSHSLSIETGRHHGIERDNRICPYCDCYVEDEYHFVMICPLYNNIRSNYIRNYFTANPYVENVCSLMSSNDKDLHNLAMYVYDAFRERQLYLDVFS